MCPMYDIAEKCKTYDNGTIIFHTDAAQCIGTTNHLSTSPFEVSSHHVTRVNKLIIIKL